MSLKRFETMLKSIAKEISASSKEINNIVIDFDEGLESIGDIIDSLNTELQSIERFCKEKLKKIDRFDMNRLEEEDSLRT